MKIFKDYESPLKQFRIAHGYTQLDLSQLTGISPKSIASYEQYPERINRASFETIMKLSNCLDCEIQDLYYIKK